MNSFTGERKNKLVKAYLYLNKFLKMKVMCLMMIKIDEEDEIDDLMNVVVTVHLWLFKYFLKNI